jgi:hypothetical protein
MNYKRLIAAIIALTVSAFTGSNVMAHGGGAGAGGGGGHGGFGGAGFRGGFNSGGFRGPGFRGGFNGGGFRGRFNGGGFRGDRFRHRDFDDRFFFFDDFGDPFFYYPYPYYGYYPYGYPYEYGYGSYDQPVYPSRAVYTGSLVSQVQLRLARAGYYHGSIDGVSGTATRRAVREYERAHGLPGDGRISQRLIATMRAG